MPTRRRFSAFVNPSELRALLDGTACARARRSASTSSRTPTPRAASSVTPASNPATTSSRSAPGVGSLTLALTDAGARVLALELDQHLVPVLREVVGDRSVEIVQGDAHGRRVGAVARRSSRWAMVSNLPYNVATPVVVRALEEAPMIDRMLVMVQREVGERLAARVDTREYGAVTVKVAYYADARGRRHRAADRVHAPAERRERAGEARAPPARRSPSTIPPRLFELVRAGFATRRKTLRNALTPVLGDHAASVLEAAGIDPKRRAETLGPRRLGRGREGGRLMRITAYAKVTLSLRVLGTRADGYHDLEALTVSVTEPHDELSSTEAGATHIEVTGAFPDRRSRRRVRTSSRAPWNPSARRVRSSSTKGIPAGAGLGGGSSDAAAILRELGGTPSRRGGARLRRPVLPAATPGVDARPGRDHRPDRRAPTARPRDRRRRTSVATHRRCTATWDDARRSEVRSVRSRRRASYPGPFVNDLEPAAERGRAAAPRFRARSSKKQPDDRHCSVRQRLRVRGLVRPTAPRAMTPRSSRALRSATGLAWRAQIIQR